MKWLMLLPFVGLVACGRKEPIPQPNETTESNTQNLAPSTASTARLVTRRDQLKLKDSAQLRTVPRSTLRPAAEHVRLPLKNLPKKAAEPSEEAP